VVDAPYVCVTAPKSAAHIEFVGRRIWIRKTETDASHSFASDNARRKNWPSREKTVRAKAHWQNSWRASTTWTMAPSASAVRTYAISASETLRRYVCYLPREAALFDGTLAFNLRFVKPAASDEELRDAAANASLCEFIQSLPKGFDQRVGPGACQLSGGSVSVLRLPELCCSGRRS